MAEIQLGIIEKLFADIIWSMEPVSTSDLVKAAKNELGWARTTTYTVLHRLCIRHHADGCSPRTFLSIRPRSR